MMFFHVDAVLDLLTAWGIATSRTTRMNWSRRSREEEAEDVAAEQPPAYRATRSPDASPTLDQRKAGGQRLR